MNKPQKALKKNTWRLWSIGLLLLSGFLLVSANLAAANSPQQDAQEGAQLFQKNCNACHAIGKGDLIGPDLQGVTQRRDLTWLAKFISNPDQVLASNDPIANELLNKYQVRMPNLGLTDSQVQALLAYLENPDAAGTAAGAPSGVLSGGQPGSGKALFAGQNPLANGGPACIACHSTAGIGSLGGGTLGPDLTQVYTRLGAPGLSSALQGLPFPTMQGVFVNRLLTPQEQADLFAYFQQIDQQPVTTSAANNLNLWFWGIGGLGALVLFGILLAFWPRQRQSISARLRKTA